ncbi:MAG TPA: His/Gly/Thr/Pro-type tRNA ligase C-terminal domain-containing protein, partial [Acidobacteriota bacterium]|nr:His/Gly/Thr/Pro-type tRNA ligase C-terminal domain-containing protein [Acidobacteriota bacterium]
DLSLKGRRLMICGANQDDYHLKNVTPDQDFNARYVDLRSVEAGQACINCARPLKVSKAIEVGHIFKLGYKYSKSMNATVLGKDGEPVPVIMGSYGIGVERIMTSAVELYHDEQGIVWPRSIAPFEVVISLLRPDDPDQKAAAGQLYAKLSQLGIECILDDRDERPGVKFKDAELVGIPIRVTVGKKLSQGEVELFSRKDKEHRVVPLESAVAEIQKSLDTYPL